MQRNLLSEFSKLIIELNKLSPDIAELDMHNNLDATRRIVAGLNNFEHHQLIPFAKKVRGIRTEILSKKRVIK